MPATSCDERQAARLWDTVRPHPRVEPRGLRARWVRVQASVQASVQACVRRVRTRDAHDDPGEVARESGARRMVPVRIVGPSCVPARTSLAASNHPCAADGRW